MMNFIRTIAGLVLFALTASVVPADDADEPADRPNVVVETLVTGLDHPCGLAVQPSTGTVFISESGAGRVVKFSPTESGKPRPVVTGFPLDAFGKDPTYKIGPLGLAFLHQNLLVVGGGGSKAGEEVIRVFELPGDDGSADAESTDVDPLDYKNTMQTLGPIPAGEASSTGEGDFYGLVVSPSALWVTSNGDDEKGWVLKANIVGNRLEELTPFIRSKEATHFNAPTGIAVRNLREFMVVAQMGKIDTPRDSVLAFFHMKSGSLMMALPAGLHDVVGLAYSPQSNRLYAVDFAWSSPEEGGVYRLDSARINGRVGVKPVKLASLDRPTALAFALDNTLYVTAFGDKEHKTNDDATTKDGVLVKITGDL